MNLKELYTKELGVLTGRKPVISYEFFPPKDDFDGTKSDALMEEISILNKFYPSLVSLTIGAGGHNQDLAIKLVDRFKNQAGLNVMPHLTCINSTRGDIESSLKAMEALGIENILALRGDEPGGKLEGKSEGKSAVLNNLEQSFYRDFRYANELVDFVRANSNFSIAVAGYPEGHIESTSLKSDIENLKRKVDCGADVIFTQLFFNNEKFFAFVERVRAAGIQVPIVAGIMPVLSLQQLKKITSMIRVQIPFDMKNFVVRHADDSDAIKNFGIEFASNQCENLIRNEVSGLHFYTLNKSYSVSQILENVL